ncbi:hypothetical protein EGW08_022700 [Elysia chlorotica]|uniref:acetyl-CoA carboxytransferase n=1 Tax=Elysia chlorotica TaxID=188477 RepID=A0A433SK88_ELYCH|nr:hypothetical protein EGW08_022700 [Elysia chlorotica]
MNYLDFESKIKEVEDKITSLSHVLGDEKAELELQKLDKKRLELMESTYSKLTDWQMVQMSRHPNRPYFKDLLPLVFDDFQELHGDRNFGDDLAVIGGLAKLAGQPVMVIGQEKGRDTKSKIKHNFGMMHPEGYRKALRLMKLAEKFNMPIITFIDTPGAYPGIKAEERGQSEAIARNLFEMSGLKVPVVCIVIGEGCSGGALDSGDKDKKGNTIYSLYDYVQQGSGDGMSYELVHGVSDIKIEYALTSEITNGQIDINWHKIDKESINAGNGKVAALKSYRFNSKDEIEDTQKGFVGFIRKRQKTLEIFTDENKYEIAIPEDIGDDYNVKVGWDLKYGHWEMLLVMYDKDKLFTNYAMLEELFKEDSVEELVDDMNARWVSVGAGKDIKTAKKTSKAKAKKQASKSSSEKVATVKTSDNQFVKDNIIDVQWFFDEGDRAPELVLFRNGTKDTSPDTNTDTNTDSKSKTKSKGSKSKRQKIEVYYSTHESSDAEYVMKLGDKLSVKVMQLDYDFNIIQEIDGALQNPQLLIDFDAVKLTINKAYLQSDALDAKAQAIRDLQGDEDDPEDENVVDDSKGSAKDSNKSLTGGEKAFVRSQEGAEDKPELGQQALEEIMLNSNDIVIGIAASGRTPYVIGALEYANKGFESL